MIDNDVFHLRQRTRVFHAEAGARDNFAETAGAKRAPFRQERPEPVLKTDEGFKTADGIGGFAGDNGLDEMQRQMPFGLQTLDEIEPVDMHRAVESDIALGAIGLGQQAFADIISDGFASDACDPFQLFHLHRRFLRQHARQISAEFSNHSAH